MPGKVATIPAAASTRSASITGAAAKPVARTRSTAGASISSKATSSVTSKAASTPSSTHLPASEKPRARTIAVTSSSGSTSSTSSSTSTSRTASTATSTTSTRVSAQKSKVSATASRPTAAPASIPFSSSAKTARSRAPATQTTSKSAPSASRKTDTIVDKTWTEAQVLEALAAPKSFPMALPYYVLLQLGTTAQNLHLDPELGTCYTFATAPAKLAPTRRVYFAKQLVNAGLSFLAHLTTSSWSAAANEASEHVPHVHAAINTFRIASRFLLLPREDTSSDTMAKQKELEVETVILRTCTKLKTIGFANIAHADSEYLGRIAAASIDDAATDSNATPHTMLLPSFQTPSSARIAFLIDLQSSSAAHALESADLAALDSILSDLNHENGPLAWQLYARRNGGGEVRVLDRAAFAIERAISKALQRLDAPNSQEHLPLRTLALQLLVQVSDLDLSAFWERVARTGGAALKTAQKNGEDMVAVYHAVQDMFETVIATATNVAENSEPNPKLQCDGFQRFCEYWLSFARKAGSSVGVERATAAMSGVESSTRSDLIQSPDAMADATSFSAEQTSTIESASLPKLSDKEVAKICAILTGSVLALDKVLAGSSEADTQAKLDNAARILEKQVAAWPVSSPLSSQLKLYRVLDQLYRRSCSKLSNQGCDSRGQPKPDATGSADVDRLARACLQLLHSLYQRTETPASTSDLASLAPSSTPIRTAALPTRDACLTDIVYGYRVLANKLFNNISRSARDEALNEMSTCRTLLQQDLAESLPKKLVSEQLRLLSTSFYNPAGILYNSSNYVEAAVFLQLAVDCDVKSLQLLRESDTQLPAPEEDELEIALAQRQEALNKKLEYTAVAYRFAGSKLESLQTYRKLLFAHACAANQSLIRNVADGSVDQAFKSPDCKGLANSIKAIVDLSVHELGFDMDLCDRSHSLANWLLGSTQLESSVKGAILEQAVSLLEARSHLSIAVRAINNLHRALLEVYSASSFPLRRARTLARRLETDVSSHALLLSEDDVTQLEEDALACLDGPVLVNDERLARFQPQYRCSVLLSTALHARLRKPFNDPQTVAAKVESACKGLSSALTVQSKIAQPATVLASRSSPNNAPVTTVMTPRTRNAPRKAIAPSGKTATTRKALTQCSAPSQPTGTPIANVTTPPSKFGKPAFDATASVLPCQTLKSKTTAGAHTIDRLQYFCQSLLVFHEAFSALALSRCSVQILKLVRQATRHGAEIAPGLEETFCRASIELSQVYLALGKVSRAESALQCATGVLSRNASPRSAPDKLLLVSQDVRFRCLMAHAELLSHDRDLVGAQARFVEGIKHVKELIKGDKPASSSIDRLCQRERQAIAFSACAHVQLARGDLAASIEATTLALRQLIRLSSNLSHIASKTQTSEGDQTQVVLSEQLAPSSDAVMDEQNDQRMKQGQQHQQEQQLPQFCSAVFSSLFWRCCGRLLDSYMRLSRLHSIRGSAVDAEAIAGEGIDFATSLRFALPLARALVQRGELRLLLNRTEQGQEDLSRCLDLLQNTRIPEVMSLSYVQGDCLMRIEQLGEALRSYTSGEATLQSLSSAFAEAEHVMPSPRAPTHHRRRSSLCSSAAQMRARLSSSGKGIDLVLPEVQSKLLQRQAWILHLMGESERSEEAVEKATLIWDGIATVDTRVEQFVLEGRIALRKALEHLKNDHFFSMLPEAAISIPMVPSVSVRTLVGATRSHQTISEDTVRMALEMLTPADSAFREALSLGLLSSHSLVLREAFASLAQVYTTQAALGRNVKTAANAAAALLDWASSIGVRRNLLLAISSKLRGPKAALDDGEWPSTAFGEVRHNSIVSHTQRGHSVEEQESDEEEALPTRLAKLSLNKSTRTLPATPATQYNSLSAFWQSVRMRHQQALHESDTTKHLLPRNWTVISISVRSTDVQNLVLTRQEGGGGLDGCTAKEAVLYSLPMNRRSQRDGTEEEEEQLTLEAAQEKLVEIVRLSNDGIHGVKDVQSMDARRRWWTERHRLDNELRDLLQMIQDIWLGGFKGVFSEPASDVRAIATLRARFEKIIRRACFPTANKRPAKLKLDDAVFECFAGLPADCTNEDLEDLVHYVMDALQFSGFQVAVDEIDLDETAMDLRGALEEFNGKKAQTSPNKTNMAYVAVDEEDEMQDHHMFLVLDKDTTVFPWESMPILRNRAVSRIPSMAFLQDRIAMAKVFCQNSGVSQDDDDDEMGELELSPLQKGKPGARSRSRSPIKALRPAKVSTLGGSRTSATQAADHTMAAAANSAWQIALRNGKLFSLSKRKTFYLLNPGGDLVQSQERFEPWLQGRNASHGWKGIVGRHPIVDELPDALSSSDLVLYFGHGGAEQFIRQSKVRELQRCAVTMLWGCSSAMLHDNGEFDGTGTPLNYMCAGAPAMVGNLWDMTDRELDSICEGVFGRLGLMEARERAPVKPAARNIKLDSRGHLQASRAPIDMSLARAVAESRNDCRLPYLTGAATVVYGVPVYWRDSDL